MTSAIEKKALSFVSEAESKLTSFSFTYLLNKSQKYYDAAELYQQAANTFKKGKKWKEAGEQYENACNMLLRVNEKYEAASTYIKAAHCMKKADGNEAMTYMKKAVELYTDEGKFSSAAKYEKEIAETYDANNMLVEAIQHYSESAEYYDGDGLTSSAQQCKLKVGELSAKIGKFEDATKIFEKAAVDSLSNDLTKWNARDYLFKAGLCLLCYSEPTDIMEALNRYSDILAEFSRSPENALLTALAESIESFDVTKFSTAAKKYDQMARMDEWKFSLLRVAKERIDHNMKSFGEEFSDGFGEEFESNEEDELM